MSVFEHIGFLDAGERRALLSVADLTRGLPVLDVGVGTGRTTALLRLLTSDYRAVDYSPGMVEEFKKNFPSLRATVGDARDLADVADASYALVLFSNNAIDAVPHSDRVAVLDEFARVTRPDGYVVFSTLRRGGASYRETPVMFSRRGDASLVDLTIHNLRTMRHPGYIRNWLRGRRKAHDHIGWAVGPLAAHGFTLVVHFTTYGDLVSLLSHSGLVAVTIYDNHGHVIDSEDSCADSGNFTVVARRRAT